MTRWKNIGGYLAHVIAVFFIVGWYGAPYSLEHSRSQLMIFILVAIACAWARLTER